MSPNDIWRNPETEVSISEELKRIPRWSIALAALAFVYMQYVFWVMLPGHSHHHTSTTLSFRLYISFSWSVMAALYVLMVGYVSQDAPRRNMSTAFWIFICLMPGGIGSVLYFMLRLPVVSLCPSCGTRIHSDFHFCPQCGYQVSPACGNCHRSVRVTDLHCVQCGHDLATDNAPSRLRAFHT